MFCLLVLENKSSSSQGSHPSGAAIKTKDQDHQHEGSVVEKQRIRYKSMHKECPDWFLIAEKMANFLMLKR